MRGSCRSTPKPRRSRHRPIPFSSLKALSACGAGHARTTRPIHDWLDATKESFADFRHRALRHHAHGVFEAERVFGMAIVNSDGRTVPVRYIAEQHIKEDCGGRIPTVADWLSQLRPAPWMSRGYRRTHANGSARDLGHGDAACRWPERDGGA